MFTSLHRIFFVLLFCFVFVFSQNSFKEAYKKAIKENKKAFTYKGKKYTNKKYKKLKKRNTQKNIPFRKEINLEEESLKSITYEKYTRKRGKIKKKITLQEALEDAIEANVPLFTHYVKGKLKTFTNKSYKPKGSESIFFRVRQQKTITVKLSDLKRNPRNDKEYAFFYELPYSFADRIRKDRIAIRVILGREMLGVKEIFVEAIKTNKNRMQNHGFIELKNNSKIEKISIWIVIKKQTMEEKMIGLIEKKFKPEIVYSPGDSKSSITKNIGLKKGEYGFKVSWFTDHPNITEDGSVSRLENLDSIGAMIAKVSKDIIKTNVVNKKKKVQTNEVVALFSFTNLIVKGVKKTSGVVDIFGQVIGLEGNGIIFDPGKGVVINQSVQLEKKLGEEVLQKIYFNEMDYDSAFPFSSEGKVYFSPNKSEILASTQVNNSYNEGIVETVRLSQWTYQLSPYNEIPIAGGNTFEESIVSQGVGGADYSIKLSLKKKAKKFVCTLGAHQSTVEVLNRLFTEFPATDWWDPKTGSMWDAGHLYNNGWPNEWLLKIGEEAHRLQPSKFANINKRSTGANLKKAWNISGSISYIDKLNFVNQWNTSAKFTDYTKFAVKILDDGGQVIWESGEMTQGMKKEIDIKVEDLEEITITVFALDRGEMQHKVFKSIDELTPRSMILNMNATDLMLRDKNAVKNEALLRENTVGDFVIWGNAHIEYIHQEKDGTINQPPKMSSY